MVQAAVAGAKVGGARVEVKVAGERVREAEVRVEVVAAEEVWGVARGKCRRSGTRTCHNA